jgi:hypothetical protein
MVVVMDMRSMYEGDSGRCGSSGDGSITLSNLICLHLTALSRPQSQTSRTSSPASQLQGQGADHQQCCSVYLTGGYTGPSSEQVPRSSLALPAGKY